MDLTVKQTLNTSIYVDLGRENDFSDREILESIPWVGWLETWLLSLKNNLPPGNGYEVSLRLTSDREIQILNSQYRALDRPTDVLAFAATEADFPLPIELNEPLYLGDIIISYDTALSQAQTQNHSLTVELAWLASHGLLHLLGWDHPDETSLNIMLEKQRDLLKLVDIVGNYS
ncbi:MAG: rRNA maturation RNase YbeY [Pleurocapsa sp.]